MTRKIILSAGAWAALGLLAGCGSTSVFDRERPDEFAVTRNAPIVVPKDFTLPPPAAAAQTASGADTKQEVLDAMFGGTAPAPRQ